jgi:hypothetical protein
MRSVLFTALTLVFVTPTTAIAQTAPLPVVSALAEASPDEATSPEPSAKDSGVAQREIQGMADKLNDPSTQAAMAAMLGSVTRALLDIRVDKMAKALEPLNGGKKIKMKGNTVREIATRDDPKFERKIEDGTKTAVRSAGSLAQALAVMLPELQKAAKKMGDALPNMR